MNIKKGFLLTVMVLGSCLGVSRATAQVVVVNSAATFADMTKQAVGDVLLGRAQALPDGSHVTIVIARQSAATDKMLPDLAEGQTIDQFEASWKRLAYVGKGRMPLFVANNQELLEKVASTPGAIGLAEGTGGAGVKTVAIK